MINEQRILKLQAALELIAAGEFEEEDNSFWCKWCGESMPDTNPAKTHTPDMHIDCPVNIALNALSETAELDGFTYKEAIDKFFPKDYVSAEHKEPERLDVPRTIKGTKHEKTWVVLNACFGSFSVSNAGLMWLREHGCEYAINSAELQGEVYEDGSVIGDVYEFTDFHLLDIPRNDALLIECIETLGTAAVSGVRALLKIVEIPANIEFTIMNNDGIEHISEKHRTWPWR